MQRAIRLGGVSVSYELERKRVKNINLRIRSDGSVYVSAPGRTAVAEIERFMSSKEDFILKALKTSAEKAPVPLNYSDGERVSVLGRERVIRILPSAKNQAEISGGEVTLLMKDTGDAALREKTLKRLLAALCVETVTGLCEEAFPFFAKHGVEYPEIKFRRMKSRWGSCASQKGILTFNLALVYAPMDCVEYVVYHEFTHFLHPDHSPAFYNCLALNIPDWKQRRKRLSVYSAYTER